MSLVVCQWKYRPNFRFGPLTISSCDKLIVFATFNKWRLSMAVTKQVSPKEVDCSIPEETRTFVIERDTPPEIADKKIVQIGDGACEFD